ncbi:MAG: HNH endonuclease [Lachnospiraceae bacterium]|nr:HNH endonuclease [Lachnospiraceae bacterium]MBQ8947957.1 HNH endonuclease [Lachnospiraceae bacterium]
MPRKARKPCGYPGCPELIEIGQKYCPVHREKCGEDRPGAAQRGYDGKWRKFRAWYIKTHQPCFCTECLKEGQYVMATDLDHIKTVRDHPELRFDPDNINPLCHRHHSEKTQREDRNPEYRY